MISNPARPNSLSLIGSWSMLGDKVYCFQSPREKVTFRNAKNTVVSNL